jgi:hypothetical protein
MLTNPYLATELAPWTAARHAGSGSPAAPNTPAPRACQGVSPRRAGPSADDRFPKAQPPGDASPINHTAAANSRPKKGGSPWPP